MNFTDYNRIVIVGGPSTGKTTLARKIANEWLERHISGAAYTTATDDYIAKSSWEDAPNDILAGWLEIPSFAPAVMEGVQTARVLRRVAKTRPELLSSIADLVVVLTHAFNPLSARQAGMASGIKKIFAEVEPLLTCKVVRIGER